MLVAVLCAGMLAGALSLPQDEGQVAPRFPAEVETEASRIFNSTMSPFCPGMLIANCPSPGAANMKEEIRTQLAAGLSPDSVRALLFAAYGDQLRATPPARGFGLLAWLVPILGLLGGGAGVTWWLRRRGRQPLVIEPAPTALAPESEERLDRELAKL
jgi:cytochrome c-type biogenesis protein CcmH